MNRFFSNEDTVITEKYVEIYGEDVNHIRNVLRLRVGEEITLCNGLGCDYLCKLSDITQEKVVADIVDICDNLSELDTKITLFQGYPKSDKLELIIQKTIELGVSRIVPVMTKRTVVKLDDKKAGKKTKRYEGIALAAAKQCGRGIVPEITEPVSFKEAIDMAKYLDMSIIPYEEAEGIEYSRKVLSDIKGKRTLGIFIGPEGGFDREEVELAMKSGIIPITLGHRILRTETAGMAVMSIIMFEIEK